MTIFFRLFCEGVVYFNHRFGCQKCLVVGVYDRNCKRLQYARFNEPKRTDNAFRNRDQPAHHKQISILETLRNADGSPLLDMVNHFPTSDPLHLLDEGVMKKCLGMWMNGTRLRKKWSRDTIDRINNGILEWNQQLPRDINRKLRTLQYLSHWKATEFRSLLLYMGIVALKDFLNENEYTHFLCLSLGIRLYSCRTYVGKSNFKQIARKLLSDYCENFVKLYGDCEVVSNIHNISHVADDVDRFGSLTDTSTYPFENHLREIKLRVQPSRSPIQQIANRIIELSSGGNTYQVEFNKKKYEPELKYEFQLLGQIMYEFIQLKPNLILSSKCNADKWFITKSGDIVEMLCATTMRNSFFIFGEPIKHKFDFFKIPYASSLTDIYSSDGQQNEGRLYECNEIKAKLVCLSYHDHYIFIPLLHTFDELNES